MNERARLRAAQSEAYALFGRLLARGLQPDLLPRVEALPELGGPLSAFRDAAGRVDLDEAAAAHHRLFGFEVFPLVSAFSDPEGRAGGAVTDRVQADLRRAGLKVAADLPADHVGAVLEGLSTVTGAEADALRDGLEPEAVRGARLAQDLLDRHLLPVLPALEWAVAQEDAPFFGDLVERVVELAVHHRGALPAVAEPAPAPAETLDARLDRPETSLKDVVAHLLVPARAGAFLSRAAIARVGRAGRIPRGFGSRGQALRTLLYGAIDYDTFGEVAARLAAVFEDAARSFAAWERAHPAPVATHARPWQDRAAATAAGLRRMSAGFAPPV